MITSRASKPVATQSVVSRSSHWLRTPVGGIFRAIKTIGDIVEEGETIGVIADPFGETEADIIAKSGGIIIGRTNLPVANQGDALFHVAKVFSLEKAEGRLEQLEQELDADPLFHDAGVV